MTGFAKNACAATIAVMLLSTSQAWGAADLVPTAFAPPATMGVYVGQQPDLIHHQGDYAEVAVAKVKGTLFGREVEWDSWATPAGVHTTEVIEPINREHADILVHVFVTAPDGEGVDAMRKIAETLALTKPISLKSRPETRSVRSG